LEHYDFDKVKEIIGPRNLCLVEHVPEWDQEAGKAYRVSYAENIIGWIPLAPTLEGFEKTKLNQEWLAAAEKVRAWLDSRLKYEGEESWQVPVANVLYYKNGGHNFLDGDPRQISLMFELVD
jgi:hypothetical protein